MNHNEEELQKARAQRLREQLARLKAGKTAKEFGSESSGSAQESPHDFVQRRMREIASSQHRPNPSKENQQ